MILLPGSVFWLWLTGLLALLLLGAALFLLWAAVRPRRTVTRTRTADGDLVRDDRVPELRTRRRLTVRRLPLIAGLLLLLWVVAGSSFLLLAYRGGDDDPRPLRSTSQQRITRPDGTQLFFESWGKVGGPTVVLTHGWGFDSDEWYYAKRQLAERFRVITWDLRGSGRSTAPPNNDYALDRMAEDLDAVIQSAGGAPVVLAGHSIGGMVNLTYCRLFPQRLGAEVVGIAQLNTTYKNPASTTSNAERSQGLQKTVGEPLLHVSAALSPVLRGLNWLAYHSGLLHLRLASSSFAGTQTREQLDFAARYYVQTPPAVVMRGTLAMLHWDATEVLPHVNVPVLIVAGEQDRTTTKDASEHMQRTMPRARLLTVSPAAHLGVLERYGEYNRAVAEFATVCFAQRR